MRAATSVRLGKTYDLSREAPQACSTNAWLSARNATPDAGDSVSWCVCDPDLPNCAGISIIPKLIADSSGERSARAALTDLTVDRRVSECCKKSVDRLN